jgi:MraZ protein
LVFQGAHAYHIDEKGRLKLPADFAQELGAAFTVTRGSRDCLWAMPAEAWAAMNERLRSPSLMDQRMLALQRWFIGSAQTLSLDAQGRVTLPPVLREFAGIRHEIMMVGIGDKIELWSRERWDSYQNTMSDEAIEELARSAGL